MYTRAYSTVVFFVVLLVGTTMIYNNIKEGKNGLSSCSSETIHECAFRNSMCYKCPRRIGEHLFLLILYVSDRNHNSLVEFE